MYVRLFGPCDLYRKGSCVKASSCYPTEKTRPQLLALGCIYSDKLWLRKNRIRVNDTQGNTLRLHSLKQCVLERDKILQLNTVSDYFVQLYLALLRHNNKQCNQLQKLKSSSRCRNVGITTKEYGIFEPDGTQREQFHEVCN